MLEVDVLKGILTIIGNAVVYLPLLIVYFCFFVHRSKGDIFFIFLWPLYEYMLTLWDLAFPWLTIGHVLGNQYYLIGWYSFFGSYGGTLWVLFIGYFLFKILTQPKIRRRYSFCVLVLLILPFASTIQYFGQTSLEAKSEDSVKVLAYISNFGTNKYNATKRLYKSIINTPEVDFIITPEIFYNDLAPNDLVNGELSNFFEQFFVAYPKTKFIIGTEILNSNKDKFNGVAVLSKDTLLIRTKKRYVPFTEYTSPIIRHWFHSPYKLNLKDNQRYIQNEIKLFPIVCYESIFPIFVARHSHDVDFLVLQTSEIFMNNSYYGRKQYLDIVRIRAIENRKPLLKVSFGGKSCLILPNGKIGKEITNPVNLLKINPQPANSYFNNFINFF